MRRLLVLFVICLVTCTGRAGADENWPNLHGPRNNSHSDSTGLPLTWSETENIVWKVAIHDAGWSSPVVWGDQIWVTTATNDGKQSFAVCVDRQSGKIVHDLKLFETAEPENTRQYNTFASPTPVIEAGRVYVTFGSYGTACLDTNSGKTIWARHDLPCKHWRGPACSPILYDNLLIVHFDDYDYQYVVALDKRTGKTVWKKDRDIDYGTDNGDLKKAYGTPLVIEANGRKQLISQASMATISYDPQTGEELWRFRFGGHSTAARPLFGHGLVFMLSGTDKKMYAVKPDGRGDVTATHVTWDFAKGMPRHPTPLLIGDLIYVVDDGGVMTCLEAMTGKVVYAERLGGGDYWSSPVYADGRIYCTNQQGKTTVVAPKRALRILATNELTGFFRASPAVTGRSLIQRSETHLYRIEQRK
ncbi:MAG: PQQ-binding-like beta-propeller repeat protein [Planctomycetia bacterium]|nr:PQQ-binding-like beta-propeller repeat protein [Planctomycetia bacterium]